MIAPDDPRVVHAPAPSPADVERAAEVLGVPASRLALLVPLLLAMGGGAAPSDELVPLFGCGLERNAARLAAKNGDLPVTKRGRTLYTRRSAVLALVPSHGTPAAVAAPPTSAITLSDLATRERQPRTRAR